MGEDKVGNLIKPKIFYSTEEVAEMLHCSKRHIGHMKKHGMIQGICTGRGYVFSKEELETWHRTYCGFDLSSEEKIKIAVIEKGRSQPSKARASKK